MARYFDLWWEQRGPRAVADFLGSRLEDVFPIAYDIRDHAIGDPDALVGSFEQEPTERLTQEELIGMAVATSRPR